MTNKQAKSPETITLTAAQREQIAECLVNERDTHSILDRRFATLRISEPPPQESDEYKRLGLKLGIDYSVSRPSKRDRLLHAVEEMYRRSRGQGVLHLVRTLHDPVAYSGNPDSFRMFCARINRIFRFSGVEYRDDGKFHRVGQTRDLSEAERRARAVANKLSSRRIHSEVQRYCKAEYMEENYFHAVFEAAKGLAERIRQKTGLEVDGVNLVKQSFERPKAGLPKLAFNSLASETERNEHDGFTDLLLGTFRLFRNPISHTPKVNWHRNTDDAVDCLTLISLLHFALDECYPVPTNP